MPSAIIQGIQEGQTKTMRQMEPRSTLAKLPDQDQAVNGIVPEIGPARHPQRVRVSAGVSAGLLERKVQPDYPADARDARIQGTVVLRAVISKDGSIEKLTLVSGHPMLAPAAIDAVKQ
jgi:outer membrane biosynthesis protein TonB